MDDLLRDLAAAERAVSRLKGQAGEADSLPTPSCRPAWRILLDAMESREAFEKWWRQHGRGCPVCHDTRERVEREVRRAVPEGASQTAYAPSASPLAAAAEPEAAYAPPDPFLADLPDHVDDPAEARRLAARIRELHDQGLIPETQRPRLLALEWLPTRLREALGKPSPADEG